MRLRDALPAEIPTQRLRLRQPILADLDMLVEGANNWNVIEPTASLPFPYLREHGLGFIERVVVREDQRSYAVARLSDDRLIGIAGLKFTENAPPELGYWLGEPHWGKGFAQEAVTGLLNAAAVAGIKSIRARVLASNPASKTVLEKTGFRVIEQTTSVVDRHRGKPLYVLEWRG